MQCPLCGTQTLEPTYRKGIELDICPGCRGIWLDRGEIDKLLEAPDPPPPPKGPPTVPIPPPPRRATSKNERKKTQGKKDKSRKKSAAARLADALEDVFD